jgi:hypothetical protein
MRLLVAGCSFSSGWGLESLEQSWPDILAKKLGVDLDNRALESSSNSDIFLQAMRDNKRYDIIVVQWTALGRISLSPSPVNPSVIVSHPNKFFDASMPDIGSQNLRNFYKIMSLANGDWRHYFDLISMIEILQDDPRFIFVNGLLDWDLDFFDRQWSIPIEIPNQFIENLLQINEFDDKMLSGLLSKVLVARNKIDRSRWVNLTSSWQESKIDAVSLTDQHPGIQSQKLFSESVYNFIKENHA